MSAVGFIDHSDFLSIDHERLLALIARRLADARTLALVRTLVSQKWLHSARGTSTPGRAARGSRGAADHQPGSRTKE